ncbi:MAG: multicopper oxidase domain-containing protein [Alphaproteobacteria bacterium]|nr:multicopper oxidase domain-containing protein [Alphaproteobacteria bacterium]
MLSGTAALAGAIHPARVLASLPSTGTADHTIRIATGLIELGRDRIVSTKTYNGHFPGPLLRMTEGKRVVIDIHNDTDTPEQLHWHGQFLAAEVDGAAEEGTPYIPAHGMRRVSFVPRPAGFRFFHSHLAARRDLAAGLYSGQAGLVFVEPKHSPGDFDVEAFVTLKEFAPFLTRTEMPNDILSPVTIVPELRARALADLDASLKAGRKPGFEVAYSFFAVNGRSLGEGEPIRVRKGQRLRLHVLNASASEIRGLALPGHAFKVIALDGYDVPRPTLVPVLRLGPAERITATVEMNQPGIWVLGEVDDDARKAGMGIVVEYAGMRGAPQWRSPASSRWDYTLFGNAPPRESAAPETRTLTFSARPGGRDGFDEFAINGTPFSMERMEPMLQFRIGQRYRLKLRNATDDVHPLHLHRHGFEISEYAGKKTSGVIKDVVMLGGFQEMSVDFTADQPGLSLFHCHMQHHMDYGFMALFHSA